MKFKPKHKLINKGRKRRAEEERLSAEAEKQANSWHIPYGKTLKIISCWSGLRCGSENRTAFSGGIGTQIDSLQLLEYIVSKYPFLDYGTPVDICLINHVPGIEESKRMDRGLYDEYRKILYSVHGKKTKNGKIFVLEKENRGFSMGAFDHVYRLLKDDYDYFFFCEDDLLILKNNYTKSILDNTAFLKKNELGWVITWRAVYRPRRAPTIIGCNGFTNKKTLKKIKGIPNHDPIDPYVVRGDPQSGHWGGYHHSMEKRLGHILVENNASITQSPTCSDPKAQTKWRCEISWNNSFIINPRQDQIPQISTITNNQITIDPIFYNPNE